MDARCSFDSPPLSDVRLGEAPFLDLCVPLACKIAMLAEFSSVAAGFCGSTLATLVFTVCGT